MSKATKKEFAELCSIDPKHITTYANRGKIIIDQFGFIDTKHEVNRLFLASKNAKIDEKESNSERKSTKKDVNSSEKSEKREELYEIEKKRKEADLRNKEIEIRLNLLKEEKLMGSTMPIDLVKNIISALGKAYVVEFKNGIEGIIRILTKSKDFNREEVAHIRGEMMNILNESAKKSIAKAKKDVKAIAENYSITRSVGEHD